MSDSDTLMIFLLKAHRPETYRDNFNSVNLNVTPEQLSEMTDAELESYKQRLTKSK